MASILKLGHYVPSHDHNSAIITIATKITKLLFLVSLVNIPWSIFFIYITPVINQLTLF